MIAVAAVPAAALGVLAQVVWTARRPRPDLQPGYDVEALAAPAQEVGPGTRPVELVFLGDSLAAGVGAPTASESLPALVAGRVADRIGRSVHVVGHGVSGERTAGVTATQVPLVRGPVDVVVVVIGSNDVTGLTPPWDLYRDTRELLAAVNSAAVGRAGGPPVVLTGIPLFGGPLLRPPLLWVAAAYAKVLRGIQRRAARRPVGPGATSAPGGVTLVEIAREASPRFAGRPEAMSGDGYHPSPVGYGFWADAIAPAVVEAYAAAVAYSASR